MTVRREASTPPLLPGYEYLRELGLGGSADVFLYHQVMPRRDVAVKVLLAGSLDDEVRARFASEANLMAQLSHHPSIVTVHHAAISSDGRPYLVMEYCSRPSLAERCRTERVGIAEALRIGVRLASAVETAHRAGIMHRDIKPANVLTTDFGWPALTDFGIAATTRTGASVGMSIPWAPPEMLAERPGGDERSDVYSLAATIYTLVAGRAPFEIVGAANGAAEQVARIERAPLPRVGRPDVPEELDAVLARAMAKDPAWRYGSALEVALALQQIEVLLRLPVTPLDLPDRPSDTVVRPSAPTDLSASAQALDVTRRRPVLTAGPAALPPGDPAGGGTGSAEGRDASAAATPADQEVSGGRSRVLTAVLAALVVVAAIIGLVVVWLDGATSRPGPQDTFAQPQIDPRAAAVLAPTDLRGERQDDGSVLFTWRNPAPQAGDRYRWGLVTAQADEPLDVVDEAQVRVPAADADGEVCIQVLVVRVDRSMSDEAARGCAG